MEKSNLQHEVLELIHVIHNQLEVISGSAHLIGLSPTLSERDRQDLANIQQAAHKIAEITQAIRQQAFNRGQ